MYHWIKIFAILFFVVFMLGCAKKIAQSETKDFTRDPSIESKVLRLKTVGIADTTIAFISGLINGKDSIDGEVKINPLAFSSIIFISQLTGNKIHIEANNEGQFNQYLHSDTYTILVSSVCYNQLKIENVAFSTGEIKELNVLLGFKTKIY